MGSLLISLNPWDYFQDNVFNFNLFHGACIKPKKKQPKTVGIVLELMTTSFWFNKTTYTCQKSFHIQHPLLPLPSPLRVAFPEDQLRDRPQKPEIILLSIEIEQPPGVLSLRISICSQNRVSAKYIYFFPKSNYTTSSWLHDFFLYRPQLFHPTFRMKSAFWKLDLVLSLRSNRLGDGLPRSVHDLPILIIIITSWNRAFL